jgi:Stress responsive A/B Barrel Domain
MIKHIIMWKLHEEAEGFSKVGNALRIKKELEGLQGKISEIFKLEVGLNISKSEIAYDVVLYSEFNSKEDLQIYQDHPAHIALKKFIYNLRSERHVVDYEVWVSEVSV